MRAEKEYVDFFGRLGGNQTFSENVRIADQIWEADLVASSTSFLVFKLGRTARPVFFFALRDNGPAPRGLRPLGPAPAPRFISSSLLLCESWLAAVCRCSRLSGCNRRAPPRCCHSAHQSTQTTLQTRCLALC